FSNFCNLSLFTCPSITLHSSGSSRSSVLQVIPIQRGEAVAPRTRPRAGADFEPYANNGGTVVAVAGGDYCIIAADTRLADEYAILSRRVSRLHEVSPRSFIASAGCWADTRGLVTLLDADARSYAWRNGRPLSVRALCQMLSMRLYSRRGFPFYTFNVVGGLDASGAGWVCGFDAVGSFERHAAVCVGAGSALLQGVLDRLLGSGAAERTGDSGGEDNNASGGRNGGSKGSGDGVSVGRGGGRGGEKECGQDVVVSVDCDEALALLERAFLAGSEREITLGDEVEFAVVTRDGVRRHRLQLMS
ncbi:unnamed protein product, partial [Phaeothamnion confervicola]